MRNLSALTAIAACATVLVACTPPPPVAFDRLQGVSAKAVTVIMGAPEIDERWDSKTGPVTWRREVRERYSTPRRVFRKGRWIFDGHTIHEFALTCDLTAHLSDGRIAKANLTGAARACDAIRADAARITALVDILTEEGTTAPQSTTEAE